MDAKENSKINSITTNEGRIIVGRIYPGCELIEGIKKICKDNNLRFGSVICAIGSLSKGCITYVVPCEEGKLKVKYEESTYIEGPLELISCQGIIGEDENGNFEIHLHGMMSNKDMRVIAGHFLNKGNVVLATAEITILELKDVKIIRKYDEETNFNLFNFKK